MKKMAVVFCVVALAMCASASMATTWNFANDFGTSNPSGAWSYWGYSDPGTTYGCLCQLGYNLDGTYVGLHSTEWEYGIYWQAEFLGNQFPHIAKFTKMAAGAIPINAAIIDPGIEQNSEGVVCWTAPTAGSYTIDAAFANACEWATTDMYIGVVQGGLPGYNSGWAKGFSNYTELFSSNFYYSGASMSCVRSYNGSVSLNAGDALVFRVDRMGTGGADSVALNATITSTVPEPSSLLALIPGLLGLGLRLRKRH